VRLISLTTATVENNQATTLLARYFEKALFMGAFFILLLFLPSILFAQQSCALSPKSSVEYAKVKWVYDGDTLLVTDQKGNNKRKIRIIGIDTPEVKHHQQKAQLFGSKAREELRALLKKHNYQIILEFDKDKRDRYDRELAYTYLKNGDSISEWLLIRGYAKTLIIPPNVRHADCFKKAEKIAQAKKLRLWKLKNNQIKTVKELKNKTKGYIRLKAKIRRIKESKKTIILEVESRFKKPLQLRIKKKHLNYFKSIKLDKLVNQEVLVTGRLKKKKGKRTINLYHSSQLVIFSAHNEPKNVIVPSIKWSLEK